MCILCECNFKRTAVCGWELRVAPWWFHFLFFVLPVAALPCSGYKRKVVVRKYDEHDDTEHSHDDDYNEDEYDDSEDVEHDDSDGCFPAVGAAGKGSPGPALQTTSSGRVVKSATSPSKATGGAKRARSGVTMAALVSGAAGAKTCVKVHDDDLATVKGSSPGVGYAPGRTGCVGV